MNNQGVKNKGTKLIIVKERLFLQFIIEPPRKSQTYTKSKMAV
jgi:hypothetical protein